VIQTAQDLKKKEPRPIDIVLDPFLRFTSAQASGGILLLVATLAALVWANFDSQSYHHLFETRLAVSFGSFELAKTLGHWINDALMVVFFFVVGLEIKRELIIGELSSPRKAALPAAAALGGMLAPAAIYLIVNVGRAGQSGWGIPMATDIAFTIGVLALLGKAVPLPLKVFLTALAIVDDIGAVLVIALFYSDDIGWGSLGIAGIVLVILIACNFLRVRHPFVYALLGVGLWLAFLESGIHSTIAGVILALTIPASTSLATSDVVKSGRFLMSELEKKKTSAGLRPNTNEEQSVLESLEEISEAAQTPMQRLEHTLAPWSTFLIMPLFALANAGLDLSDGLVLAHPASLGIMAGLCIGKPLGITLFSWLAVRSGLAALGADVSWKQIFAGGCLAGIGFTMSLFIANLAFPTSDLLEVSKAGVLVASLLSACFGAVLLRRFSGTAPDSPRGHHV
jgi:NhaA family Na+:H+ antiporter